LDPTSAHRIPGAQPGRRVIVVCNEGYSSSLAAVTLQDLGIAEATDLVGGYRAWRALHP
jgi:rhodanese-related sulfurtransferase